MTETPENTLGNQCPDDTNETGRDCAPTQATALEHKHLAIGGVGMSRCGHYTDSIPTDNSEFKKSREYAFRRVIRQEIRRGPFTRSEREVTLALINHWFHHRHDPKGVIHPGRKKLAKRAKVSIPTVTRTLALLREHGAIDARAHLHGLHGNATEYAIDTDALTAFCRRKRADIRAEGESKRVNGESKVPTRGRIKMIHRISNVVPFPTRNKNTSTGAA